MSSPFPSSEEQLVASAILLLQTAPPTLSFSTPKSSSDSKCSDPEGSRIRFKSLRDRSISFAPDRILASASSVTNDNGVSSGEEEEEKPIKPRCVSFLSATARYHQMKFKIVRKIRSKVIWTASYSGHRKPKAGAASEVSSGSLSGDTSSSLSSSSSARSLRYANRVRSKSARVAAIRHEEPPPQQQKQKQKRSKNAQSSPHLRRRGEEILKLLTVGGCSELRIRVL
ncbi:hypothetical protein PIB30_054034 [Stylosanthes scabra]|uniref:HTH three-helical bundle domain-containing protein n=1 Tax=Stylosanthes scabra TaxID=79078 RepID=A0ABU6QJ23_9FABA|nr:hypothetical protein [Stylosanthes scabra]